MKRHCLVSCIKTHTGTWSVKREASVSYCNVWKTWCKNRLRLSELHSKGNFQDSFTWGFQHYWSLVRYCAEADIFQFFFLQWNERRKKKQNIVTFYENVSSCNVARWKSDLMEFPFNRLQHPRNWEKWGGIWFARKSRIEGTETWFPFHAAAPSDVYLVHQAFTSYFS